MSSGPLVTAPAVAGQSIAEVTVHRLNLVPGLRVRLSLTADQLRVESPDLALGIIKIGTRRESYSLALVTSVHAVTSTDLKRIGLAALVFFAGGALSAGPEIRLPWLPFIVVALAIIATSFKAYFSVAEATGDVVFYEVAWLDRAKIFAFAKDVARVTSQGPWLVHRRHEEPPVQAAAVTPPPVVSQAASDLAALTSLAEMRSHGLISDADYDAKKQEILARL